MDASPPIINNFEFTNKKALVELLDKQLLEVNPKIDTIPAIKRFVITLEANKKRNIDLWGQQNSSKIRTIDDELKNFTKRYERIIKILNFLSIYMEKKALVNLNLYDITKYVEQIYPTAKNIDLATEISFSNIRLIFNKLLITRKISAKLRKMIEDLGPPGRYYYIKNLAENSSQLRKLMILIDAWKDDTLEDKTKEANVETTLASLMALITRHGERDIMKDTVNHILHGTPGLEGTRVCFKGEQGCTNEKTAKPPAATDIQKTEPLNVKPR